MRISEREEEKGGLLQRHHLQKQNPIEIGHSQKFTNTKSISLSVSLCLSVCLSLSSSLSPLPVSQSPSTQSPLSSPPSAHSLLSPLSLSLSLSLSHSLSLSLSLCVSVCLSLLSAGLRSFATMCSQIGNSSPMLSLGSQAWMDVWCVGNDLNELEVNSKHEGRERLALFCVLKASKT